jgi:tol-pal system protein YbgF
LALIVAFAYAEGMMRDGVSPAALERGLARMRAALACAAIHAVALAVGCAETVEDRQLADLARGVEKEQSAIDRAEPRINENDTLAKVPGARSENTPARPAPHTVQLGDGTDEAQASNEADGVLNGDDPNDTTPRPIIRITGLRPARRGVRGVDQIDETLPDEPTAGGIAGPPIRVGGPPPSALDEEARRSYDAALALVNGRRFDQALDAFAAFLVKWPDHPNADNAMYWRGESYYAKGEYAHAAEEFEGATLRFPLGNKVPDCLLKLGLCQQKLGNEAKATAYFDRLAREFPRSEAARRIPMDRTRIAGPQENP